MYQWLQKPLQKIQSYAADYFQAVFKTSILFWKMPPLPSGANILTGAFAGFLIVASRFERSLPTDHVTLQIVISLAFVYVLFVSGIALWSDPGLPNRIATWRQLVSVVSIAISLGCGLVAFAWIVDWTLPLDSLSNLMMFSDVGANRILAAVSGALVSAILFANSAVNAGGVPALLKSRRTVIWSMVFFCIVSLGISLVLITLPS
ncbi:hypothetical protein [Bradyrhizobium sp. dw_78]|uniref:hypothetical protein n=1 Tax=Bradyrhizobium sp. dw_78 TaxID=2719793 RepID=UPI001BD2D413|nr:hypothetical protein [Bradyrhizobium sp. dw_78]